MNRWGPLLLIALCLVIHWPLDRADFTFDDDGFVTTNPLITSVGGAAAGFTLPFPPGQPERALYRPLTGASYALDYARAGLHPPAFHNTNVVLYIGLVLLIHQLALAYGLSAGLALATACLFAAHPVHCDAVDSVSGRSEILSLLFAVAALLCFQRSAASPSVRALSPANLATAALYAAACLAKETGSVLLAVLLVQRVAFLPRPAGSLRLDSALLRPLLPHACVLVVYALLRSAVLGRLSPDAAILADASLLTRLFTMGEVFWLDLKLLLLPTTLQLDFFYQVALGIPQAFTWRALLGWLAMGGFAAFAIRLGLRTLRGPSPLAGHAAPALCALALFLVPLAPTSHVLDIGALFAERFLFAPSLGFVLLCVIGGRALLARVLPARALLATALALSVTLTVAGGVRSQARALEWRDAVKLWRSTGEAIHDKRVHSNLAAAYIARGKFELALTQIDAALAIEPEFRPALGNRGVVLLQLGQLAAARDTFTALAQRDPNDALAWFNLGRVELAAAAPALAAAHFEKALAIEKHFAAAAEGLREARSAAESEPQRER